MEEAFGGWRSLFRLQMEIGKKWMDEFSRTGGKLGGCGG
jgi:hypothetical protein